MPEDRKQDHLDIVSTRDVASRAVTGLDRYALWHCALPEIRLDDVSTATVFLGHPLGAPLLISSMTGGTDRARAVNERLARAAQRYGLPMGVGSQRAGIENPELMLTYGVRDVAPDVLLLANVGAVQLNYGIGIDACLRAVDAIGANALILHLNPLQEAIQPEGNTDFRALLPRIVALCENSPVPVIVKEVGWGIAPDLARRLRDAGVAAIDVAGSGGTSWSRVESYRVGNEAEVEVAEAFDDWGIPTSLALTRARDACPGMPLIASGGIRHGVDVVKCLALGAGLVGMARPLLAAAMESAEAIDHRMHVLQRQMRIAMFCLAVTTVAEIGARHIYRRDEV
jgi:isopentenyl-diphosphate delta-isomerase